MRIELSEHKGFNRVHDKCIHKRVLRVGPTIYVVHDACCV